MSVRAGARRDVLVADGVDFYRRMLLELLRGQGYQVHEAENAEEALAQIERERPDLLILDLNLPPRGGRALLDELAAGGAPPLHAVVLAHGFYDEAETGRLRSRGVAACVQRSAPIDDLLVATRNALFPEAKDLRRSPRAQVHIPVAYRVESETGELSGDESSHTFNLSADGMFIVATGAAPPPPGTKLQIRFWLPAAPAVIEAEGVLVWCNQAGGRVNELYPPGMGVMFLGLKRETAAHINEYVRERTLNAYR